MNLYKIFSCILILFLAQIFTWFQMFGQFKWEFFKTHVWVIILSGLPITVMYYYSTRLGVEGFGNTWSLRIIQFVMGIVVFWALNTYFLNEQLNWKNGISLVLCLIIVLIQALWK